MQLQNKINNSSFESFEIVQSFGFELREFKNLFSFESISAWNLYKYRFAYTYSLLP